MARQVTIVGPDPSGFSWTCGQCGETGTEATSEEAMAAFNEHWDSAVIPPVDPWIGTVLDAGQGLADAAGEGPAANAWLQALGAVPTAVAAAWRDPGNVHPAD
ncbi:hypothetical protein [Streptomyces sp. NPDC026673]|uniref:hypothetical protein n=1 Tax=Streptomyces sp. NPDC026673 TaxID=3155724 RepID=UPI00340DCF78